MKRLLLTLLPWMVTTVAAYAGQARSAEVHFTYLGSLPERGIRVDDECYVPVELLKRLGWEYRVHNSSALIVTNDKKRARVNLRSINGGQAIPLRAALDQIGALTEWQSGTDVLDVTSPVRKIVVRNDRLEFQTEFSVKPKVFALTNPPRLVVDIQGARINGATDVDADMDVARISQYKPDTVRLVLNTGFAPELPSSEPAICKTFSYTAVAAANQDTDNPGQIVNPPKDQQVTEPDPPVVPPGNAAPPIDRPVVGPLTLDLEGPSSVLLNLKNATALVQAPRFRRPDPRVLEIVLPGVQMQIDPDFKIESGSITGVSTREENGSTVLMLGLVRPMGVELSNSGRNLMIQLLKPKVGDGRLAGKIVVVDAGHGGEDSGTKSPAKDAMEKNLTLAIAKKLSKELADDGATVIMTRKTDVFIPLKERANIANRNQADFFISVHINSNGGKANTTSGGITFYHGGNAIGQLLADCIQREIAKVSGIPSIGTWSDTKIYQTGFSVLRNTTMPGVLLELGFMNHFRDRKRMLTQDFQNSVAKAVVKGLHTYLGDDKENQEESGN
jgi:N-acetylmuramoyl-L-alanine amidase